MKAATLLAGVLALVCSAPAVQANDYPNKPITLIIGFAPGGPSDVMARILTKRMEELLRQPVIIENRAGAGGGIAANLVARVQGFVRQIHYKDGDEVTYQTVASSGVSGLTTDTKYFVKVVDANTIQLLATSTADVAMKPSTTINRLCAAASSTAPTMVAISKPPNWRSTSRGSVIAPVRCIA